MGSPNSGGRIVEEALRNAGYAVNSTANFVLLLQAFERGIDNHFKNLDREDPACLLTQLGPETIKDNIHRLFSNMINRHHNDVPWLDRTSDLKTIEMMPTLQSIWRNSRFIFVKCRGIETISARLEQFPQRSFEHHCTDWANFMSAWRQIVTNYAGLKTMELDLWDICNVPDGAAAALAALLEFPVQAQFKIAKIFNGNPSKTSFATLQTIGWDEQKRQIFHALCDEQMRAYGYTTDRHYRTKCDPGIELYLPREAVLEKRDPHDLASFLALLESDDVSLTELLRFYINYQGLIFLDQAYQFNKKVRALQSLEKLDFDVEAALRPNNPAGLNLLARGVPGLEDYNYRPGSNSDFLQTTILDGGINELFDKALVPEPFRWKLGMKARPPFSAFTRSGGNLFAGPFQYQYFIDADGIYYPDAASRQFSKSILETPRVKISGHVILIQDTGSGSNFCHFAYDWITRIIYAIKSGLADKQDAVFIMGGERGRFQDVMVKALSDIYGLNDTNFLFPQSRMIIDVDGYFSFFSDQRLHTMHPAQMAHRQSMEYLAEITARIYSPASNAEKIFISRKDAYFRQIVNEDELSSIAATRGYKTVILATLPLEEQFALFRGARKIAGAHGMGFTHLMFCEKPVSVLELFHPKTGTDAYAMICKARGFDYHYLVSQKPPGDRASYHIDPDDFTRMLDIMDATE
jgi:hypothetical protein